MGGDRAFKREPSSNAAFLVGESISRGVVRGEAEAGVRVVDVHRGESAASWDGYLTQAEASGREVRGQGVKGAVDAEGCWGC